MSVESPSFIIPTEFNVDFSKRQLEIMRGRAEGGKKRKSQTK